MSSFLYIQRTGDLRQDGSLFSKGYSGKYTGKNEPNMQSVPFTGPIPCGVYRIGDAYDHPHLGPLTMDLTPDVANEMFGRSAFRIHGDNPTHIGASSDGCIVLPHVARQEISGLIQNGTDRMLEVVAELPEETK